jgi:hypothetical protein
VTGTELTPYRDYILKGNTPEPKDRVVEVTFLGTTTLLSMPWVKSTMGKNSTSPEARPRRRPACRVAGVRGLRA